MRQKKYATATRLLARGACRSQVRKVVMTGAATSVIGDKPKTEGAYEDSNEWANASDVTRPNERAKILAERACWDEVLQYQAENGDSATRLTTLLPYFMCGPPLYKESYNSSCQAIQAIITNS